MLCWVVLSVFWVFLIYCAFTCKKIMGSMLRYNICVRNMLIQAVTWNYAGHQKQFKAAKWNSLSVSKVRYIYNSTRTTRTRWICMCLRKKKKLLVSSSVYFFWPWVLKREKKDQFLNIWLPGEFVLVHAVKHPNQQGAALSKFIWVSTGFINRFNEWIQFRWKNLLYYFKNEVHCVYSCCIDQTHSTAVL